MASLIFRGEGYSLASDSKMRPCAKYIAKGPAMKLKILIPLLLLIACAAALIFVAVTDIHIDQTEISKDIPYDQKNP